MSYGLSFASISAMIVHAILYFRKPLAIHMFRSLGEQPDVHAQLMTKYRQGKSIVLQFNRNDRGTDSGMLVPEWWYVVSC